MASLYIHVPFCRQKCPYCDFYSVQEGDDDLADFPSLLIQQLKLLSNEHPLPPLQTIFWGGGTPSLLSPESIGNVLDKAAATCGIANNAEISLEANPGTVTLERLIDYRSAGINRLSLGVQSLQSPALTLLGRIHSPEEARKALDWARQAGFSSVSADLMFALPNQATSSLLRDATELAARCHHLSCYGLSVEEQTPFYHLHRQGKLILPEEQIYADQFLALHETLTACGLGHYEISNYAREGHTCRHNLAYWRRTTCLGLGAGAHAFRDRGWGERYAAPADLARYKRLLNEGKNPEQHLETFDRQGAMSETLYLGLRTAEGVDDAVFRNRFGLGVDEAFPDAIRRCSPHLQLIENRWRFDPRSWLLFDHLIMPFLS